MTTEPREDENAATEGTPTTTGPHDGRSPDKEEPHGDRGPKTTAGSPETHDPQE